MKKWIEKAKERQGWVTCVLQAQLFGLFTCKSLLIRGWRRTDDRSRLSSPPVMQAYLRALWLYLENSALTERHAAEQPSGAATQRQHAEDAGTLCTLSHKNMAELWCSITRRFLLQLSKCYKLFLFLMFFSPQFLILVHFAPKWVTWLCF